MRNRLSSTGTLSANYISVLDTIGSAGLYLFAFGLLFKVAQANQGMILMILALLPKVMISERHLTRDPLFLIGCFFLLYLLFRTIYAWQEYPLIHEDILYMAKRWALSGPLGIFIVAYWCHLRSNDMPYLLLLALSGFLLRILFRFEWHNADMTLQAYWLGEQRTSFGFSANNLGTWSAITLIGLMVYIRPLLNSASSRSGLILRFSVWVMIFSVMLACLFFSQTRSAWLAFFLLLPITIVWLVRINHHKEKQGFLPLLILVGFLGLLASFFLDHEFFNSRLNSEQDVIAQILTADLEEIPATSIGQRVEMYRLGWQYFLERPFIGWGPGLAKSLIATSKMEALIQNAYIHFHSMIFDMIVQLGLIGVCVFTALIGLLMSTLVRGYQQGRTSSNLLVFVCTSWAIFLISGLVSEPLLSASVPYFPAFMGGLAYMTRFKLNST